MFSLSFSSAAASMDRQRQNCRRLSSTSAAAFPPKTSSNFSAPVSLLRCEDLGGEELGRKIRSSSKKNMFSFSLSFSFEKSDDKS